MISQCPGKLLIKAILNGYKKSFEGKYKEMTQDVCTVINLIWWSNKILGDIKWKQKHLFIQFFFYFYF